MRQWEVALQSVHLQQNLLKEKQRLGGEHNSQIPGKNSPVVSSCGTAITGSGPGAAIGVLGTFFRGGSARLGAAGIGMLTGVVTADRSTGEPGVGSDELAEGISSDNEAVSFAIRGEAAALERSGGESSRLEGSACSSSARVIVSFVETAGPTG
jgi:hypothetical protein